jgi:hypothetical protein
MGSRTVVPASRRRLVNEAASIRPVPSARRHRIELAAKARRLRPVSAGVTHGAVREPGAAAPL